MDWGGNPHRAPMGGEVEVGRRKENEREKKSDGETERQRDTETQRERMIR